MMLPTASRAGEPPLPILLVHGLGDSGSLWVQQAPSGDSLLDFLNAKFGQGVAPLNDECVISFNLAQGTTDPSILGNTVDEVVPIEGLDGCPETARVFRMNFDSGQEGHPDSNCAAVFLQAKAIQLAIARIKDHTEASKLIVIGHSMGGLSGLAYLAGNGNGDDQPDFFQNDVAKLVTLGTPFHGAPAATFSEFQCSQNTNAERDLVALGSNILLEGGNESSTQVFYWPDVNANGFFGNVLDRLLDAPLPAPTEGFWVIGDVGGPTGDCIVPVSSQSRPVGERKRIDASHTTTGPCPDSCTETWAHYVLIEALDEADSRQTAWPVKTEVELTGFITHSGDTDPNPISQDRDWFEFDLQGPGVWRLSAHAGEIAIDLLTVEDQAGQNLLAASLSQYESETFDIVVPSTSSKLYLRLAGEAEGVFSGIGELGTACATGSFDPIDHPYSFRLDPAGAPGLTLTIVPPVVVRPASAALTISLRTPEGQPIPSAPVRIQQPLAPGGYSGCIVSPLGCETSTAANGNAVVSYTPSSDGNFSFTATSDYGGIASATLTVQSGGLSATAAPNPATVNVPGMLTATVSGVSPLSGRTITFATSHPGMFYGAGCQFSPCTRVTNAAGVAEIGYTAQAVGTAQISVTSPDLSGTVLTLPVLAPSSNFNVTLSVFYRNGDTGSTTYEIEATVRTAEGQPIAGERVDWATTRGVLSDPWSSTASTGIAEVDLTVTTAGTTTVTGTVRGTPFSTTFEAQIGQQSGGIMVPVRTLTVGTGEVFGVAWAASGTVLVAAEENGTVRAWDGATGNVLWTATASDDDVGQVAISPDGSRALVGNSDGYDVYQVSNGQLLATVDFATSSDRIVNSAMTSSTAFHRNNRTAVYSHPNLSSQGNLAYTVPAADDDFDFSGHMAFSPHRNWVAAVNSSGVFFVNSTVNGSLVRREDMGSGSHARGAGDTDFDSTSSRLAATAFNTIRVYDLASGTWTFSTLTAPVLGNDEKLAVSFLDGDSKLAVGASGKVAVLSLPGGTTFRSGSVPGWAWETDWSSARQELAVGSSTGTVTVFRPLDPVDGQSPTINVSAPIENFVTFANSLATTGQVSDASAIVEFTINGEAVTLGPGGSFTHLINLAPGANTITFIARDAATNLGQVQRTVTRLIDTAPPVVSGVVATPAVVLVGEPVSLSASVVDGDSAVATAEAVIKLNGTPQATLPMALQQGSTYYTSINTVALGSGSFTIDVRATDSSPQANQAVVQGAASFVAQTPAVMRLGAISLDFGNVPVSTQSVRSLVVHNDGQATLNGVAATIAPFDLSSGTPYSIPGGGSAQIQVSFRPPSELPYQGLLHLTGGGGGSIPLEGRGVFAGGTLFRDGFESGDLRVWWPGDTARNPIAVTEPASTVSSSAATLEGNVNARSTATNFFFEWSPDLSYSTQAARSPAGSGSAPIPVALSVGDLACSTTYHFRVAAENAFGRSYGADESFQTGACSGQPLVETLPASAVGDTSATLNATVNPLGLPSSAWFEWGSTPSLGSSTPGQNVPSNDFPNPVSFDLAVLSCEETYYFRIVAENVDGSSAGQTLSFSTAPCPGTGSLVGYWPFDSDSLDHSGYGNHGSWSGGGGGLSPGRFGAGANFVPSQFYSIADSDTLRTFTSMTIAAWFKPGASPPGPEDLFGGGSDGDQSRYTLAIVSPDQVTFSGYNTLLEPSVMPNAHPIPSFLGQWHHLASTWNGSSVKVYLNGQEVLSGTFTGTVSVPSSSPLFINRHIWGGGSGSSRLTGQIDDLAVFDRALAPGEIMALASDLNSNGVADFWDASPPPTLPVGHYEFDEGSGTTATDSAGSNDGVISGAGWVAGHSGTALSFGSPAESSVAVPRTLYDGLGNSAYVGAWVYPTSFPPAPFPATVFRKRGAYNDWSLEVNSSGHVFSLITGEGGVGALASSVLSPAPLPLNSWSQIESEFDGTTMRLYVNGTLVDADTQPLILDWDAPTCPTDAPYNDGCYYGSWIGATSEYSRTQVNGSYVFLGVIDDVIVGHERP